MFNLLAYLVENRDRVVTRGELLEKLWKGKVVTDSALGARLKDVRKAVGDNGSRQDVIKTIHGRGYQFVADVREAATNGYSGEAKYGLRGLPSLPDKPSIAVLPFTNISGDPGQEYFADGMTDEIITGLSRVPGLFVIANSSTMTYKGRAVDVKFVGREQGVRYVLEGSIRKSGNQVRVTAQLIDAVSGHHLWAEHYDRELADIFVVQDDISHSVVVELQVKLVTGERARPWATGTKSVKAWEQVTIAKSYIERHARDGAALAKPLVLEALELDPNYSAAWAMLAWIYWEEAIWGWTDDPDKSIQLALDAARKSLAIEHPYPGAYAAMGYILLYLGEIESAIESCRKAIELAPSDCSAMACFGNMLIETGHFEEGIQTLEKAIRLSPFPITWYLTSLGMGYHLNGDNESAIPILEKTARQEPDSLFSWMFLASALAENGDLDEAREIGKKMVAIDPNLSVSTLTTMGLEYLDESIQQRIQRNFLAAGVPD